jgi:hypothetical protein
MYKLFVVCGALIYILLFAPFAYAGFYPGIGSDVSFTDQNNIFYTLYGTLGYAPSYKTYTSIGYTHEWDFTQTTNIQEFHIINGSLYQRISKNWRLGGLASYTFGATSNTDGYYSVSLKIDPRYAINDKFSIGAGPLYYYIKGPGDFIGVFAGLYIYPDYNWFLYFKGTIDSAIDPDVSQQDTALEIGASYNINTYIGLYAMYRLSTGITTYPINNFNGNGNGSAKNGMGTMSMGGMNNGASSHTGNGSMNHSPQISYSSTTISTITLGLSVTF